MLTIQAVDPDSADARVLLSELSATLASITGDSGASSFHADDVRGPQSLFVVAYDSLGDALGCGAFRPLDDGIAEVKRMYARASASSTGSAILAHLEFVAAQYGYRAVRLETRVVNVRAMAFYARHGYRRIDNFGHYAGRSEAACFEKNLLQAASVPR